MAAVLVFAAIVAAFFVLALLSGCAGDSPLCLISCTVIVRNDSAGDDAVELRNQDSLQRAREWLMRQERAAQKP